jgi:predicted nucleic acid-binding protein
MTLVVDASVIIKWLLQDPEREAGTEKASQLMDLIARGEQSALQPPHWLAEIGAVLARESPETAADDVTMLSALELSATDDPLTLRRGVELAIELKQHLFDTLYHAVALETPDTTLVTADQRYFRAAREKGRIVDLMDWSWRAGEAP